MASRHSSLRSYAFGSDPIRYHPGLSPNAEPQGGEGSKGGMLVFGLKDPYRCCLKAKYWRFRVFIDQY